MRRSLLALTLLLASAGPLLAQPATVLPPVAYDAPGCGSDPCGFDRALFAPNMFGNVLGTRWFVVTAPGFGAGGGAAGGTTRTISGVLRDSTPANAPFVAVFPKT